MPPNWPKRKSFIVFGFHFFFLFTLKGHVCAHSLTCCWQDEEEDNRSALMRGKMCTEGKYSQKNQCEQVHYPESEPVLQSQEDSTSCPVQYKRPLISSPCWFDLSCFPWPHLSEAVSQCPLQCKCPGSIQLTGDSTLGYLTNTLNKYQSTYGKYWPQSTEQPWQHILLSHSLMSVLAAFYSPRAFALPITLDRHNPTNLIKLQK